MAAVSIWGTYLAIGACRWGTAHGLIVFGCVLLFLLAWAVLLTMPRSQPIPPNPAPAFDGASRRSDRGPSDHRLNLACVAAVMLAIACLVFGYIWYRDPSGPWPRLSVWTSSLAFPAALITALIGLSNPRRHRGKLLGLLVFPILAMALAVWMLR